LLQFLLLFLDDVVIKLDGVGVFGLEVVVLGEISGGVRVWLAEVLLVG